MSKTGKEIKITSFKNYNVVIGSTNNKNCKANYINISAWADPQIDDEVSYNRVIRDINKKIKQSLFNLLTTHDYEDFSEDKTIVDLDIRESGIRYGKRSFINCEITLFLNSEIQVNSEYMKLMLDKIIDNLINSILEQNKSFKFYKKKK